MIIDWELGSVKPTDTEPKLAARIDLEESSQMDSLSVPSSENKQNEQTSSNQDEASETAKKSAKKLLTTTAVFVPEEDLAPPTKDTDFEEGGETIFCELEKLQSYLDYGFGYSTLAPNFNVCSSTKSGTMIEYSYSDLLRCFKKWSKKVRIEKDECFIKDFAVE